MRGGGRAGAREEGAPPTDIRLPFGRAPSARHGTARRCERQAGVKPFFAVRATLRRVAGLRGCQPAASDGLWPRGAAMPSRRGQFFGLRRKRRVWGRVQKRTRSGRGALCRLCDVPAGGRAAHPRCTLAPCSRSGRGAVSDRAVARLGFRGLLPQFQGVLGLTTFKGLVRA